MNEEEIRQSIISRTDDGLIEILVNKSEYRKEYVLIAEAEIKKRNINDHIFKERCSEILKNTTIEKNRIEDLSGKEKVVIFFGLFIFVFRVLGFYKLPLVPKTIDYVNAGYDRKAEKIIIYKWFSITFWAVFIVLTYVSCDFYLADQRRIEYENKKCANQAFNPLAMLALTSLTGRYIEVNRYQENKYYFQVFGAKIGGRLT